MTKKLYKLKKLKEALEKDDRTTAFNLVEEIKEDERKKGYPMLRRFEMNRTCHNKPSICCEFHSYFEIAKECLK